MHKWLAIAIIALLAGCTDAPATELTKAEASARADQALETFQSNLETLDAGQMSRMEGAFTFEEEGMTGSFDMIVQWGQNDAMYILMDADIPFFAFKIEAWCYQDASFVGFEGLIYETRQSEECNPDAFEEEMDFGDLELSELDMQDVEIQSDGTIIASYEDQDGIATVYLNPKGQLTRIDMEMDGVVGSFELTYGSKSAIQPPQSDARLPLTHSEYYNSNGNSITWEALGGETAPLEEFQVRLTNFGETIHTFNLAGNQRQGNYTFEYVDNGDGLLSEGDLFTLTHDELPPSQWTEEWSVYDAWADANINESLDMPALPIWMLAAVIGLVVALRRK